MAIPCAAASSISEAASGLVDNMVILFSGICIAYTVCNFLPAFL
jgi:hypothetical protein